MNSWLFGRKICFIAYARFNSTPRGYPAVPVAAFFQSWWWRHIPVMVVAAIPSRGRTGKGHSTALLDIPPDLHGVSPIPVA
jgi:hypothetical protein